MEKKNVCDATGNNLNIMIGIYKITSPKNRIYIGQSININQRFTSYNNINQNLSHVRLKNSFNKYGVENHKFEIIEICLNEQLNERERYWQEFYDVLSKKGLNCKLTSTNDKSGYLSKEIKDKISKAHAGKKLSQKTKDKISEFMKTRPISEFQKQRSSECNKGKIISNEQKELLSNLRKQEYLNNKLSIGKKGKDSPFAKKVKCLISNKEWNTLTECCLENNLSIKNMSKKLNGARKNNTNYIYIY